jgi:hypothetical protein
MKRTMVAAVLVALLAACAPVMLRDPESGHVTQCYATGAFPLIAQATFDADKAQCIVTASHQVPRALVTTSSGGGYTTPVQTNCYQIGNTVKCNSCGGVTMPPATTTGDANIETRDYAFDSCMGAARRPAVQACAASAASAERTGQGGRVSKQKCVDAFVWAKLD